MGMCRGRMEGMADPMDAVRTFDAAADDYDRFRPGYPEELYRAIFDYVDLGPSSALVEVGIGTGQATPPFLDLGCAVTAVEPGEHLARVCREKFARWPRFRVIVGRFEEVDLPEDTCDLVYSATAFHWVPEAAGYRRAFAMLKPGGAFARFANHPCRAGDDPRLSAALDEVYARYYYPWHGKAPASPRPCGQEQARAVADIAGKYGFVDLRWALFHRRRRFTAKEYRALLGTYSDHAAIEPGVREKFFSAIESAILDHGGTITIEDTIDLQLARRP